MPAGLGRSPVEPADIGRWLLRSTGAHWDGELAVEVQQCPLRSGAGEEARRRGGGEGAESYLKSNSPHLAGGEQTRAVIMDHRN